MVDDGTGALEGFGEITINLLNVVEPSVRVPGADDLTTKPPTGDPDDLRPPSASDSDTACGGQFISGSADGSRTDACYDSGSCEPFLYCVCLEGNSTEAGIQVPITIKHGL